MMTVMIKWAQMCRACWQVLPSTRWFSLPLTPYLWAWPPGPTSPLRALVLFIIRTHARHQAGCQGDKTPFPLILLPPQRWALMTSFFKEKGTVVTSSHGACLGLPSLIPQLLPPPNTHTYTNNLGALSRGRSLPSGVRPCRPRMQR